MRGEVFIYIVLGVRSVAVLYDEGGYGMVLEYYYQLDTSLELGQHATNVSSNVYLIWLANVEC